MEFKYLKECCKVHYPVGSYYSSTSYHYVREVTRVISETFPEGNIILVVRGTSGTILAGGVSQLLSRRGRNVTIAVSRKFEERSHSYSLEAISRSTKGAFIILDDFISTGDTLEYVIDDLYKIKNKPFDMLCISNYFSDFKDDARIQKLLADFKYICCNKEKQ